MVKKNFTKQEKEKIKQEEEYKNIIIQQKKKDELEKRIKRR